MSDPSFIDQVISVFIAGVAGGVIIRALGALR